MRVPFEKFVVQSNTVNDFYIRVGSPEAVREVLPNAQEWAKVNSEPQLGNLMMERYLFIEDAIREKLEREATRKGEAK